MKVAACRSGSMCLAFIVAFSLTFTTTKGQPPAGCYHEAVPGFMDLYRDTHSGLERKCAPGTIFDSLLCTCIHGTPKPPVCAFTAVSTDVTKYNDTTTGQVLSCKPGMVFKDLICKCVPDKRKICTPRFSLDFNTAVLENKVVRYNVGGGESLRLISGHGKFANSSSIIFWTFRNRPFETTFQIQMEFRDDPTTKANQVLLTNCNAIDHPDWPSILIFLDKSKANAAKKDLVRVTMRTYKQPQGVAVEVPYISGETNILVVLKVENSLRVRVIYQNRQESYSSNPLSGRVIKSNDYLRVGSCPRENNGLVGDMDWFDYFPCWPRQ